MAEKPKTMHVVCLHIKTTADEDRLIDRSFRALSHIHNVLVKHVRKLLVQLEHDKEYQFLRNDYIVFMASHKDEKKLSKDDAAYKKSLSDQMSEIRRDIGLTEYSLQSYIKVCGKQFKKSGGNSRELVPEMKARK